MPVEQFQKLKAIMDGFTRHAPGWDDPALDIYEQFRKPKSHTVMA